MAIVEVWEGSVSSEVLRGLYVNQCLSTYEVSRKTGIPVATVGYKLKKMGVLRSRRKAMSMHMKRQMTNWFVCPVCGEEKPLSDLVKDKRFLPWPRFSCKQCANW